MNKKKIIFSVIVILTFLIAFYGKLILSQFVSIRISNDYLKVAYFYSWWILPIAFLASLLFGFKNIFKTFGLEKGMIIGFLFTLITVSPMFISSAVIGQLSEPIEWFRLLQATVFAGLMEELLFRGFLFGVLFRNLGWGFIPAAVLGSFFFGLGHIYQGSGFAETAGIFFITALGAAWFAWLYIEWNNNLWVPVFVHILMNLSWTLFDVSPNAMGGLLANLFRVITIALTIFITIKYNKTRGLRINKVNLFVNQQHHETKVIRN